MTGKIEELENYFEEKEEIREFVGILRNEKKYSPIFENLVNDFSKKINKKIKHYENLLKEAKKDCNYFIKPFIKNNMVLENNLYYNVRLKETALDTCEGFIDDLGEEIVEIDSLINYARNAAGLVFNYFSIYQSKMILQKDFVSVLSTDDDLLEDLLTLQNEKLIDKYLEIDELNLLQKEILIKREPVGDEKIYLLKNNGEKAEIYVVNEMKASDNIYNLLKNESLNFIKKRKNNKYLNKVLNQLVTLIDLYGKYSKFEDETKDFLNTNCLRLKQEMDN